MSNVRFKIGSPDGQTGATARQAGPSGTVNSVEVGLDGQLFLIAGPCVIEDRDSSMMIARQLGRLSRKLKIGVIFKASFDKANRSSISGFRGPGMDEGLEILAEVRQETSLPVITDVHETSQVDKVSRVVDCLQIPAFLCRQTDLLCASARTGKPVNIKKGQFLSPSEMSNIVEKIRCCGNEKILLTERGTFFGYNRLVNDMTAIKTMKQIGYPVVFDATHSTQQPGVLGGSSAGRREMTPILARAAVAAGANGLFMEVHPEPAKAKSDSACVLPLEQLEGVIDSCRKIFDIVSKLNE